tara:strand:- start:1597 stop:2295 length:699 start_codon:yes stop_codon:yes gene_type:complete
MKIALCLHGLVGTDDKYGLGDRKINYKIGFKHFKEHVFDVNEQVDVFYHTWSTEQHEELKEIYNPVLSKAEEQPIFSKYGNSDRKQAIYCRWKSAQEVIKLVELSGNEYDFILLTRFDIAFLVDFNFKEYDNKKFYAQGPPGPLSNGINMINDLWFFSNFENMIKFTNLYNLLDKEEYRSHIDSNHELSRKHLDNIGMSDILEYKFVREWTGASGKLNSDTPLVRWHYLKKV